LQKDGLQKQKKLLQQITDRNDKTKREKERIAQQKDDIFSGKLNAAESHHKKRESKLIERAEELLEIKRSNFEQIQSLRTKLDVIERGYLEKRGNRNRNFKVRWFEIHKNTRNPKISELAYYAKQSDRRAKGTIILNGSISVEYVAKDIDFVVHTNKRDFNLRAPTAKEAASWVSTIRSYTEKNNN